jgi:hypothetical protein
MLTGEGPALRLIDPSNMGAPEVRAASLFVRIVVRFIGRLQRARGALVNFVRSTKQRRARLRARIAATIPAVNERRRVP